MNFVDLLLILGGVAVVALYTTIAIQWVREHL